MGELKRTIDDFIMLIESINSAYPFLLILNPDWFNLTCLDHRKGMFVFMLTQKLLRAICNRSVNLLLGAYLTCGFSASFAGLSTPVPSWHPVLSLGAGSSVAKPGVAQGFPVVNEVTDEFYYYSGTQKTQSSGFLDILLNAERGFSPDWLIQAGLDYNRTEPFFAHGLFLQGADEQSADTYFYGYKVLTNQILLNSKLLYTLKHRYHPYLFGGVGVAFNKAYNYTVNVPRFITFTRNYLDNSHIDFSYALGVGVDVDLTSNMRVGIGYRYADLGKMQLGTAIIDTTVVAGTLTQNTLHANEFLVQLSWLI
ncbi:hypothetical protein Lmor_0843 [Legionella moravica]|uniref:Opacity protein and related surface antigens n=1 Tax=Legionella moravica TaxID=39962 RepID=A0A378JVC7_9GAMM|nr:outer membrane beta-barrel protein [Legionella moravica]KTD35396.1 hypothetical protein Lmor_0843 [Legionella moravica]STX61980.1 Opacity protein and related surface antigens [Legionella moravica]